MHVCSARMIAQWVSRMPSWDYTVESHRPGVVVLHCKCQCLVCFGGILRLCNYSHRTHHQKIQTALNSGIIRVIKGSDIKKTMDILPHLGHFSQDEYQDKE